MAHATSYRLAEFLRGEETLSTLYNLVATFRQRSTSFTSAAMGVDVGLYERSLDQPKRNAAPDLTEVGMDTSVLMGIHELLQQVAHWCAASASAAAGGKTLRKPKIKAIPRPRTAKDRYEVHKNKEAFEHLEQVIHSVPVDEFRQRKTEQRQQHQQPQRRIGG